LWALPPEGEEKSKEGVVSDKAVKPRRKGREQHRKRGGNGKEMLFWKIINKNKKKRNRGGSRNVSKNLFGVRKKRKKRKVKGGRKEFVS